MSKHNFYISYTRKDGCDIAHKLFNELTVRGYSVFIDNYSIQSGTDFSVQIRSIISDCDCFIPIITPGYITSEHAYRELEFAISAAKDRAKDIFPVVACEEESIIKFKHYLSKEYFFKTNDDKQIADIADRISKLLNYKAESALLYEKLNAFTKIKDHDKAAETVCIIFSLIRNNYEELIGNKNQRIALYKEIYKLYEILYNYHGGSYTKESGRVVRIVVPELHEIEKTLLHEVRENDQSVFLTDLYCISFAIRINHLGMEIRNDCVDTWTTGDVTNSQKIENYIEYQEKYLHAYLSYLDNLEDYASSGQYSEEDIQFIKDTSKYILSISTYNEAAQSIKQKYEITDEAANLSEDEQILLSIANFTKEGNRLFNLLRKKGIAGDFLRCLLTSYERLKNYCEIVGAPQIISECVEQIAEIRTEISKTGSDRSNELAEKGIKSLLGITIAGAGNYDVFISYKSQDEDLGKAIYDFFRKNMKEPFWSKVSLPELSESEYENAIYDALDKAKHFVVVLSDLSYMKDSWVEKEMRIFHREKNENRKDKDSNFVFVVTDDLYKQIINSNKTLIPIEYRGYQIIKMSEYQDCLLQYIK